MSGLKVVVLGLMGAGKTPVGERTAHLLGVPFLDSDRELEARWGSTAAELEARDGMGAVHAAEEAILIDVLDDPDAAVFSAAASTIDSSRCRAALTSSVFVVGLDAEVDVLLDRVEGSDDRPLDDDVEAQLRRQAAERRPLLAELADLVLDTTQLDVDQAARTIAAAVRSR